MKIRYFLTFVSAVFVLSGCAPKPYYYYGKYTESQLAYVREPGDETLKFKIASIEDIIANVEEESTSKRVPPGVYADLAYLMALNGKNNEAITFFNKEKEAYPESTFFIDKVVNKINTTTK